MSNFADIDKIFTSECSSRTLQASDNGFFNNFYYTIIESFKSDDEWQNWLKNQFGKLESDEERLRLLFNDPTISWDILGTLEHVSEIYRKKDAMFSWQKREQVMKLLKQLDTTPDHHQLSYDKILILASQAVMRAPMKDVDKDIDNGLTLSLALLQRSEVFFKMNDGSNALNDLQLAVKYGLPVKNNPDYYARLAKLYSLMSEDKKCEISIKIYSQLLGYDEHRKQLLENDCHQIKRNRVESKAAAAAEALKLEQIVSSNLELKESEGEGKFFVAADKIDVGETLLVEKAKCACLYPKNFGTHCTNCFVRLVAPIGCNECASVAFCSTTCRDVALSTYHKFECKFLDLLIGSGMSILCHLTLRMVIQFQTPDKALEEGEKLSKLLCKNSSRRRSDDFFKRCLMSTFLLRCLQKAEFFGRRTTESAEPTEKELQIGGLLFSYLQSLQFNAHEIYETVTSGHKFVKSKINYIGVGIYSTGAMFNHECYPSITRHFNSTNLIFHAIRPHVKGEIVAENYGPIFTKQTLPERQRMLMSRYWFKCTCRACREDWPILDKLSTHKCRLRCPRDMCEGMLPLPPRDNTKPRKDVKCSLCKKNVSLQISLNILDEVENLFQEGALFMDDEKVDDAIEKFTKGIDLFHQIAYPPYKNLHIAQESLRSCLTIKNGNQFEVMKK